MLVWGYEAAFGRVCWQWKVKFYLQIIAFNYCSFDSLFIDYRYALCAKHYATV